MIYVNYKKRYQNFIPEERINRIKNSNYNIKLAPGESIVVDNTLLESKIKNKNDFIDIPDLYPLQWLNSPMNKLENIGYHMSYKPFIYDYLDSLKDSDIENTGAPILSSISKKGYFDDIKIVEKEMEFENELSDHYLVFNLYDFKVTPLCETNKKILDILGTGNISFYLEDHAEKVLPFYQIHIRGKHIFSDLSIKTGSLDFKNDFFFINSIMEMLKNHKFSGFTFDEVKDAPLEYLQAIELSKY